MNEIYWITRLDSINCTLGILEVIGLILAVANLWLFWVADYNKEEREKSLHRAIVLGILTSLLLIFNMFIPTTKEAYLIYGVGGTIDYVKSNKEAAKIPDKAIKALNIFLDNECKSNTDSINNK